jgi:hypothetical protein
MSDLNNANGSEGQVGGGRWMGLTAYQQILLLPPILFLAGTLAIPGVDSHISVAAGALVLVLVLVGLFWPGASRRGKRRSRGSADDDNPQDRR